MGNAHTSEFTIAFEVAVFQPVAHFLGGAGACVGADIGLAAYLPAQSNKLIDTEVVRIFHAPSVSASAGDKPSACRGRQGLVLRLQDALHRLGNRPVRRAASGHHHQQGDHHHRGRAAAYIQPQPVVRRGHGDRSINN